MKTTSLRMTSSRCLCWLVLTAAIFFRSEGTSDSILGVDFGADTTCCLFTALLLSVLFDFAAILCTEFGLMSFLRSTCSLCGLLPDLWLFNLLADGSRLISAPAASASSTELTEEASEKTTKQKRGGFCCCMASGGIDDVLQNRITSKTVPNLLRDVNEVDFLKRIYIFSHNYLEKVLTSCSFWTLCGTFPTKRCEAMSPRLPRPITVLFVAAVDAFAAAVQGGGGCFGFALAALAGGGVKVIV